MSEPQDADESLEIEGFVAMGSFVERTHLLTAVSVVARAWSYRFASKACSRLALVYVKGRINQKKGTKKSEFDKEKTNRRVISTVNGCLVADKLSFLSLEVRSCDIVLVTAVEAKNCLRATDHVSTGSVTLRSITLAYNGLHLPHSRTNTLTSRKAEHEQRVK